MYIHSHFSTYHLGKIVSINHIYEPCEQKIDEDCYFDCKKNSRCDEVKEPWPAYHIKHHVLYQYKKSFYTAIVHNFEKTLDLSKYPKLGINVFYIPITQIGEEGVPCYFSTKSWERVVFKRPTWLDLYKKDMIFVICNIGVIIGIIGFWINLFSSKKIKTN